MPKKKDRKEKMSTFKNTDTKKAEKKCRIMKM